MTDKFPHTAIQCVSAIAQHHGLQINPERLIDDYALKAEEPSTALLLRMTADIGLKSRASTLTWEDLLAQGGAMPLMARLADGNAVIVVGVRLEGDKGGQIA